MLKIIWVLIALNTVALFIFIGAYFYYSQGKSASYEEKGWTIILSIIMGVFILLAAVPLRFSQSTAALIFSGIMAILPLLLAFIFSTLK